MAKKKDDRTRAWHFYEQGKQYNDNLVPNYYTLVDTNTEFYAGNQWVHLPQTPAMSRLPKPVFNIIKRVTSVLISQIAAGGISVNLEPLSYYDGGAGDPSGINACEFAQSELSNLIEKLKLDYRLRECLFDGAQTGDYCAHFYWNPDAMPYGGASGEYRGEIEMELVDGVNIMFGNPNNRHIQDQPYVLLIGRDTVKNLRDEYLAHNPKDKQGAERIVQDSEWQEQAAYGGKLELSDNCENAKCLYLYLYEKVTTEEDMIDAEGNPMMESVLDADGNPKYEQGDDGKYLMDANGRPVEKKKKVKQMVTRVHVSKMTRTATIYEDVDTDLSVYPIAWANWEKQKNCYHGRALVTGLIPNQIFINSMYAMIMRHLQLEAFPKTVYNADLIGTFSNEIGQAIGVHGLTPGQAINQVAANLNPADMSNQILGSIDAVVGLTKECMGVSDVQLGNVKSENTSAIMVMQQNAEVPLENIRSGMYEFIEDIAQILLDMIATYYGERPISMLRTMELPVTDMASGTPTMDQYTGLMKTMTEQRRVMQPFDFSTLKNLWLNVRVDVGTSSAYSEISMMQTLDKMLESGLLSPDQYVDRVPDKLIPMKQQLLDEMRAAKMKQDGVVAGQAIPDSQTQMQMEPVQQQMNGIQEQMGTSNSKAAKGVKLNGQMFGGKLDNDYAVAQMPANVRSQFNSLPTKAKNALVRSQNLQVTAND